MAILAPTALSLLAKQDLTEELPLQAEIPEAIIAFGERWQRGRYLLQRPERRLTAGIWRSGAFRTRWFRFGGDEFFTVIEGEIRFETAGEPGVIVRAGEAALAPPGAEMVWEQPVPVLKVFMRIDPPIPIDAKMETPPVRQP